MTYAENFFYFLSFNSPEIKSAGMAPGAWTVNDSKTMQRLRALGVERIYTDQPNLLISIDEVP
jgi:glycerophosphoryl diester phosphodiesterase